MGGRNEAAAVTYVDHSRRIAITGLGMPGVGGFAGFYSRTPSSGAPMRRRRPATRRGRIRLRHRHLGGTALLTAYYSWRLMFMTFHNKPVWKGKGRPSCRTL